jgi:arylsulfatase A-like enzyme
MPSSLDTAIGRVVKAPDDNGVADNTIIVIFFDNGGVFWTPKTEKATLDPAMKTYPLPATLRYARARRASTKAAHANP